MAKSKKKTKEKNQKYPNKNVIYIQSMSGDSLNFNHHKEYHFHVCDVITAVFTIS